MHGLLSAVYATRFILSLSLGGASSKKLFHVHINTKKLTIINLQKSNLYSLNVSKAKT